MTGVLVTIWTIRSALALYAIVVFGWVAGVNSDRWLRIAKWLWAGACLLFLVHIAAAFQFYHRWSHAASFAHTAAETHRVLGLRFGWGLYFNHLFAALWVADAAWWLLSPATYLARRPRWSLVIHGYLFFIVFNGAIIFEGGAVRKAATATVAALALAAVARQRRPRPAAEHSGTSV